MRGFGICRGFVMRRSWTPVASCRLRAMINSTSSVSSVRSPSTMMGCSPSSGTSPGNGLMPQRTALGCKCPGAWPNGEARTFWPGSSCKRRLACPGLCQTKRLAFRNPGCRRSLVPLVRLKPFSRSGAVPRFPHLRGRCVCVCFRGLRPDLCNLSVHSSVTGLPVRPAHWPNPMWLRMPAAVACFAAVG